MSSTKRVSGNYDIFADLVRINGNLAVIGTQTALDTTNSKIKDNIITLNDGETGAGVTLSYSGIEVDRGILPTVGLRWNETTQKWQITTDGTIYTDILAGTASAAGTDTDIQYNNGGALGGSSNLRYDYNTSTFYIGNVEVNQNTITTSSTNGNLILSTNGTGRIVVDAASRFKNQSSDPAAEAGYNFIYAKTPGTNGTGIYFVNNSTSGEVASVNKSLLLSLIL